ncbi:hypothetical protein [Streptomyces chattanoogensis]|uniref:hypothetical protein n=1 Tax=Streptomyces chattanoogensis TaxID=66876 RepID=UPI00367E19DA
MTQPNESSEAYEPYPPYPPYPPYQPEYIPVPASAEEALAAARTHFGPVSEDGTPGSLHVEEFDIGYLIYAVFPPPADPGTPPSLGGSNLVIAKIDGALVYLPNFPSETAIALYRRKFRPNA